MLSITMVEQSEKYTNLDSLCYSKTDRKRLIDFVRHQSIVK